MIASGSWVLKAIDPSRDILPRMRDSDVVDRRLTPVTSFDERVRSFADDPGGPTILLANRGSFDPSRPVNGRIGYFAGVAEVSQTTTVTSTGDSAHVRSSATIACSQTRIPPNALMGVHTVGSSLVTILIDVARPCRYELAATIAVDPADREYGRGRAEVSLYGNDEVGIPDRVRQEFVEADGNMPAEPPMRTLRLSGVVQPGSVTLILSASIDQSGPDGRASWDASLVLVPDEPENQLRWTGASGARFGLASNWAPPAVPGAAGPGNRDTAVFDRRGNYVVDFSTAKRATAAQSHFRHVQSGGQVSFNAVNYSLESISQLLPSLLIDGESGLTLSASTLTSNFAVVGDQRSGSSEVRIDGEGSLWDCRDELRVGGFGAASATDASTMPGSRVVVRNGGELVTTDVVLGAGPQGGIVEVQGPGSSWTGGNVLVGFLGSGSVDLSDGAEATVGDILIASDGIDDPSGMGWQSSVVVSNAASADEPTRLTARDVVVRGPGARLQAAFGGEMSLRDLVVGRAPADPSGTATCYLYGTSGLEVETPHRSLVECDSVVVGDDSAAGLLVVDEGHLLAHDSMTIGRGTLAVAEDASPRTTTSRVVVSGPFSAGGLGSARIALGTGAFLDTGPATLGGSTSTDTVATAVLSPGESGGDPPRWRVRGSLSIAPDDSQAGVRLEFPASLAVDGDLNVGRYGSLAGTGIVTVGGALMLEGWIEPGLSIDVFGPQKRPSDARALRAKAAPPSGGTLTIEGDLVLAPTGEIRAVAAGPEASRVVVTGDATIDGKLVLDFRNGYAPRAGEQFEILQVGGAVAGTFATVEVQGLAPGATFDVSQSGGALVVTSAADTVALPVVTVKASPKSLVEKKAKRKGTLVFRRTGSVTEPLTVPLVFGGTAVNGDDCVQILDSVTFPARKRTVRVQVVVANDRAAEGPESLEISIAPSSSFGRSATDTARFTIVDDDFRLPRELVRRPGR
jgi:T5SS/PEP-CTERM-associated repeat protein